MANDKRIVYLSADEIKPSPWNPERRTRTEAIRGLIESMRESGFWWYMPLILGRDGALADGHRRLSAALALKITTVPCLKVDKATDVLWAEINGRRRTVTSAETLEAALNGLSVYPEQHEHAVSEYLRVVGAEQARQSYMLGVSPSILSWAKKTARYIGYESDEPMTARIVLWLRKHEMQRKVRAAMEAEIDTSLLVGCILNDTPLPRLRLEVAP